MEEAKQVAPNSNSQSVHVGTKRSRPTGMPVVAGVPPPPTMPVITAVPTVTVPGASAATRGVATVPTTVPATVPTVPTRMTAAALRSSMPRMPLVGQSGGTALAQMRANGAKSASHAARVPEAGAAAVDAKRRKLQMPSQPPMPSFPMQPGQRRVPPHSYVLPKLPPTTGTTAPPVMPMPHAQSVRNAHSRGVRQHAVHPSVHGVHGVHNMHVPQVQHMHHLPHHTQQQLRQQQQRQHRQQMKQHNEALAEARFAPRRQKAKEDFEAEMRRAERQREFQKRCDLLKKEAALQAIGTSLKNEMAQLADAFVAQWRSLHAMASAAAPSGSRVPVTSELHKDMKTFVETDDTVEALIKSAPIDEDTAEQLMKEHKERMATRVEAVVADSECFELWRRDDHRALLGKIDQRQFTRHGGAYRSVLPNVDDRTIKRLGGSARHYRDLALEETERRDFDDWLCAQPRARILGLMATVPHTMRQRAHPRLFDEEALEDVMLIRKEAQQLLVTDHRAFEVLPTGRRRQIRRMSRRTPWRSLGVVPRCSSVDEKRILRNDQRPHLCRRALAKVTLQPHLRRVQLCGVWIPVGHSVAMQRFNQRRCLARLVAVGADQITVQREGDARYEHVSLVDLLTGEVTLHEPAAKTRERREEPAHGLWVVPEIVANADIFEDAQRDLHESSAYGQRNHVASDARY